MTKANRRHLTGLVAAGAKLDTASRLIKEATIDIAGLGLFPFEVREELQRLAAKIDSYIQRRVTTTIDLIPST